MRNLNLALPQLRARHGLVAKEAVHTFYYLRDYMLDQWSMGWQDNELKRPVALFAGRETDCLGHADASMGFAYDLRPA